MDKRDLLEELLRDADAEHNKYLRECSDNEEEPKKGFYEYLADFLLANGVIVPPCKIGSTIYMLVTKRPKHGFPEFTFIKKSKLTYLNLERVMEDFGKSVFLTHADALAEAKLREVDHANDQS